MTPGFHWTLRPSVKEDDPALKAFPAALPLLVKQLLLQRGFKGGAETELFLEPRLSHLSDPFLMGEMGAAVERIFRAVDAGETVCIYGDYDVDGVTSVALLRAILMAYDLDPQYFIPVRSREGYGLSEAGMERCLCECSDKPSLLITVDCGTSSVREVDMLNKRGIDVIILDHHEAGPQGRPDAVAVVNAKIEENSPYTYLCSAGVVFKLAHALLKVRKLKTFDLKLYLDLVAVATVADIVPLVDENRILVRHGLGRLAHSRHTGLKTLTEIAGIRPLGRRQPRRIPERRACGLPDRAAHQRRRAHGLPHGCPGIAADHGQQARRPARPDAGLAQPQAAGRGGSHQDGRRPNAPQLL